MCSSSNTEYYCTCLLKTLCGIEPQYSLKALNKRGGVKFYKTMFSWLMLHLACRHLSILDLLTTPFLTDAMLWVSSVRSDSNSTLSRPTTLRGLVDGGGGLRFKVCLGVLLGGEGRRGAAARWWWPGLRVFKGQVEAGTSPWHPDTLPLVLLRSQTLHVLIPEGEGERRRIRGRKRQEQSETMCLLSCPQCLSWFWPNYPKLN